MWGKGQGRAYYPSMILTSCECEDGTTRIYATQFASVVTYFTERPDGTLALISEPGMTAYPWDFKQNEQAVRDEVVRVVAERLSVAPEKVLASSLADIAQVAEPALPESYRYASRRRTSQRWRR